MKDKDTGLRVVSKDKPEVTFDSVVEWFNGVRKGNRKKVVVTDEALELIKMSMDEPDFDGFRFQDTLITYQNALANDGVSLEDYVNAIRFCSYLESNQGNAVEAYIRAFSYRDFVKSKIDVEGNIDNEGYKQISSAATRYRKTPLVINILTQAEVPLYLMFQGYRYQAVNALVEEMRTAKLSKDRINAADRLLTHLKPPEGLEITVRGDVNTSNPVDIYADAMAKLVAEQRAMMLNGADVKQVANARITEAIVVEG